MIENAIPVLSTVYNNNIIVELFMATLLLKHTHLIVSDNIVIVHTANVIMILSDTVKLELFWTKNKLLHCDTAVGCGLFRACFDRVFSGVAALVRPRLSPPKIKMRDLGKVAPTFGASHRYICKSLEIFGNFL